MNYATRILVGTTLLLLAGCANSVTPADSTGANASSASGNLPPNTYVLDFRPMGGLNGGALLNLAFTVDLDQPVRLLNFKPDPNLAKGPGVIYSNDFTSNCSKNASLQLETHIQDLPAGTPAYVDHIDIELGRLSVPPANLVGQTLGSFCYGYREPGGPWHWVDLQSPSTYDSAADVIRNRIEVHQGPLDALKIVQNPNWQINIVSYVATTSPPGP